jgi:hypothetical protein
MALLQYQNASTSRTPYPAIQKCFTHDLSGYKPFPPEKRPVQHSHLSTFCAHFDPLGGCCNSNDDIFELPFSKSMDRLGTGVSSSILVMPDLAGLFSCTSLGNVDRRGVNAVTTLLADFRIVFRTSQDRFLAK